MFSSFTTCRASGSTFQPHPRCCFSDVQQHVLPQLCYTQASKHFENASYAYATLCSYPYLTLKNHARFCLRTAVSVLTTSPAYEFYMMVPNRSIIGTNFLKIMRSLNVKIWRYEPVGVPAAALRCHQGQGTSRWMLAYEKLHVWSLPAKRVLYLDSDALVLENLDHLLGLPDSLGCESAFNNRDPLWFYKCNPTSSIMVISPNNTSQSILFAAVKDGVGNFNHTLTCGSWCNSCDSWRWFMGDQHLITDTLKGMQILDHLSRVDMKICMLSTQTGLDYLTVIPPRRWHAIHAWGHARHDGNLSTAEGVCRRLVHNIVQHYDASLQALILEQHSLMQS